MVQFQLVAYDADTYSSFSDAAHAEGDFKVICVIDSAVTWRELRIVEKASVCTANCLGAKGSVKLQVMNNRDTVTFPLHQIMPTAGVACDGRPEKIAEQVHYGFTHTKLSLNNDDITALMKLLPLGNSSHSGLREKLHQASLAINKKKV